MRTIKFRAWDKQSESMFALFDSAQEDWYLPRWKERYEVMQYTGLRDKNGKEIYEGDIAQHRIKGIRTVVFRDGAFRTKRLKPVAGESEDAFFFYECTGKDWEVIGSIYENPELLQGGEIKCT